MFFIVKGFSDALYEIYDSPSPCINIHIIHGLSNVVIAKI